MNKKVVVIIGTGGMGLAIARRLGNGRKLVLADYDKEKLLIVASDLANAGYDVTAQPLNVTDKESFDALANLAAGLGDITVAINTAGVSSIINNPERIFEVNVIGNANFIAAFEPFVTPGTVGILIASMAGYAFASRSIELDHLIHELDSSKLSAVVEHLNIQEPSLAYSMSKRANQLQARTAAIAWGKKGARFLSVSPGIIYTPQAQDEMGVHAASMKNLIANSPANRMGTPEDIAAFVDFLTSHAASYITGVDILIDGGQTSYMESIGKISKNR